MSPARLPRRLEDLRGLRGARWVRESSRKQGDKYGPGAQKKMQDRAIERYGLVDTGLSWTVLKSGWSGADGMKDPPATQTRDFQAMLRAAENGEFDVLLVGYTSRFLRSVRLSLHYQHLFHTYGVVVLICDDKILSSDPDDWEHLLEKITADEVYSRTQSRNVRSGLEEKRHSQGDPGGQPGLGFRRENTLLVVDETEMPTVERMFALSAAGNADQQVAASLGVTIHVVRETLTNPIYIGQLRDGSPFRLGATIDMKTWNEVQARRENRRTRVPGVVRRRCYPLKLTCPHCGASLHGHTDRYRHPEPICAEFTKAQPAVAPVRGRHRTTSGTSYPREWYEAIIEQLLDRVAVSDESAIARVVRELDADADSRIDQVAIARIARAKAEAGRRLEQTRDIDSWQATMQRLDAEEAAAKTANHKRGVLTEAEIRRYLEGLGTLWRNADDEGRQALALALFDRLAVSGFKSLTYEWSATARSYGLDRLVPAELRLDLGKLGLKGRPTGEFVVRQHKVELKEVVAMPA